MPDVVGLTADYEAWLGQHIPLITDDLDRKHREMAGDPVRFLRGTYYLWLVCLPPEAFQGPNVPGVGDLHVDNFGTWQDARGVRRWGVNDLDELAWAPYALDLVRLATSAVICPRVGLSTKEACDTLLATWRSAIPSPAVDLSVPQSRHLLALVPTEKSAERYYAGLAAAPTAHPVPPLVAQAAARSAPPGWLPTWHSRVAGTGSLGHPRVVAVAGTTAREAKLLGPPTTAWAAAHRSGPLPSQDAALLGRVHRAVAGPEPLRNVDGWLLRRLGPDVVRIELAGLTGKNARRLLRSMGRAMVSVHGTDPAALASARAHEAARRPDWLRGLVSVMVESSHQQFTAWAAR